jgi:outer membrane protein assembly factor BamB
METSSLTRTALSLAPVAVLVLVSVLLSGCGTTSIFNEAAPLASGVNLPYAVGDSRTTTAGLTALSGRDGSDAWHTATGEPSDRFAPLMAHGIIYAAGRTIQPPRGTLVAMRASDGRVLWKASMPNQEFTIATDGVVVVVEAKAAGLLALDAATGVLRWQLDQPVTDPVYVKDGIVIATIAGWQGEGTHLAVYQEENGKPLWQLTYAPLVGINHAAVYASDSNEVLAYAARTGKELWHSEIAGTIVGVNDQSVLISGSQHVASLDPSTGRTLWDVPVEFDGWPGIVQTSTLVYGTHQNAVIALNASSGSQAMASTFTDYTVIQITAIQGVIFAMLAGGPESSKPARVAALDGASGRVYWQRDIQEITFLINTVPV